MESTVVTSTIPWYKSEIIWASVIAVLTFGQQIIREIAEHEFTGTAEDIVYGIGLLMGVIVFYQRTFNTTKIVEQSAGKMDGS